MWKKNIQIPNFKCVGLGFGLELFRRIKLPQRQQFTSLMLCWGAVSIWSFTIQGWMVFGWMWKYCKGWWRKSLGACESFHSKSIGTYFADTFFWDGMLGFGWEVGFELGLTCWHFAFYHSVLCWALLQRSLLWFSCWLKYFFDIFCSWRNLLTFCILPLLSHAKLW